MKIKLAKLAAQVLAASLVFALGVEWWCPGQGLHLAAEALGLNGSSEFLRFPLWSGLVRLIGCNLAGLVGLSAASAVICILLIGWCFARVLDKVVSQVRRADPEQASVLAGVEILSVPLVVLAFVLTPSVLSAATRVGPLMTFAVVPLAAVALTLRVVLTAREQGVRSFATYWRSALTVAALLTYSVVEAIFSWRYVLGETLSGLGLWMLLGVAPFMVVVHGVRRKWFEKRGCRLGVMAGWAAAVVALGLFTFLSGTLERGRVANRVVAKVVEYSHAGRALASDGPLDDLFHFMLPKGKRLLALTRVHDPAYGRELAAWVRGDEDLMFAAELGPVALIEQWAKKDLVQFRSAVTTLPDYFPTVEAWSDAVKEIRASRPNEPKLAYLKRMAGVCGNHVGCKLLDEGRTNEAWRVFWAIPRELDRENFAAYVNLGGMIERGYPADTNLVAEVNNGVREIFSRLKTGQRMLAAARAGGRVYVEEKALAAYRKTAKQEQSARELSPEAKAFIETLKAARKGPDESRKARGAIEKALNDGLTTMDRIGDELLKIDLALNDKKRAETDAIGVLRANRRHVMANAVMGMMNGFRGDYATAERYFRRAVATGQASAFMKNDLAFTLFQTGELEEARLFAQDAVKAFPNSWNLRETLAAILIKSGRLAEGEAELKRSMDLAKKAGVNAGKVVRFALDKARLQKLSGDLRACEETLRQLREQNQLSGNDRVEFEELGGESEPEGAVGGKWILVSVGLGLLLLWKAVVVFVRLKAWNLRRRHHSKSGAAFEKPAAEPPQEQTSPGPAGSRPDAAEDDQAETMPAADEPAVAAAERQVSAEPETEPIPELMSAVTEEQKAAAERLWDEAREIKHGFVPSRRSDADYLGKLTQAAKLGHVEAMDKLGTYAFRRGMMVEAYYWKWLAEAHGRGPTANPSLTEIRKQWVKNGCHKEHRNVFDDMAGACGQFAYALLCVQCGHNVANAHRRLHELARDGVSEAKFYCQRSSR